MGSNAQTKLSDLRVVRELGRGSASRVYHCEAANRHFGLKVSTDDLASGLLASEAEHLLLPRGRTLPRLVDVGKLPSELARGLDCKPGAPCLLFELAAGVRLSELCAQGPSDRTPLSPKQRQALAVSVARDVGEALAVVHDCGIAHGDVKPDNILVERRPGDADLAGSFRCTLIDLGFAAPADSPTLVGATLRYLPPEAPDLRDRRAADLWALGRCLLEVLCPETREADDLTPWLGDVPAVLAPQIAGLLHPQAKGRPAASWVSGTVDPEGSRQGRVERELQRIRRRYLIERRKELEAVKRGASPRIKLSGEAGRWLFEYCQLLERLSALTPGSNATSAVELHSLSEPRQRRWLMDLIGPAIVDFPPLPAWSDDTLATKLSALAQRRPLQSITHAALQEDDVLATGDEPPSEPLQDPLDVAVLLGGEAPSPRVLAAAEQLVLQGKHSVELLHGTVRALKRTNQLGRALALLDIAARRQTAYSPENRGLDDLERARLQLRAGDREAAQRLAAPLLSGHPSGIESAARALLGRIAIMNNAPDAAQKILGRGPPSAPWYETQAGAQLTLGHVTDARTSLERALTYPHDAEQRARVEALLANLEQQSGNDSAALQNFRRAAEYAARAGAIVEEATYLTGVAATAANLGQSAQALRAAERSTQLFEYLRQPLAAARSTLARASALSASGSPREAYHAAARARSLARSGGDARCEGFAHLIAADVGSPESAPEHAQRAAALLGTRRPDDRLRALARMWRLSEQLPEAGREGDTLARSELPAEPKLEWWWARAEIALVQDDRDGSPEILREISALAGSAAPPDVVGPAMAYGSQVAARIGDGETARRLAQLASAALATLVAGAPPDHQVSVTQNRWASLVRSPRESQISPEQIADIETLIHGLSERTQLKPLLDRVLDALVLWTGVERGLLLLRAPEGKLVPRAARNLARHDLTQDQLALSRSLALRAMETGECVVAMDAAGELPELHASVHALKLRSVLAVPLLARGDVLGVVYLDDRMRRGAFGQPELSWVRLVATLAAVAISDARDRLTLRRNARRARRAEQRLAELVDRQRIQLEAAERRLSNHPRGTRFPYEVIVGNSPAIQRLLQLLDRIAPSEVPVLIFGESGSGKELVAREIHSNGPRKDQPFIGENCSAIPETLLESTLFGHTRGAFTGASRARAGLFEVANGGTLFLDEIADMSLTMQAKLLRVLENGEVRRLGAESAVHVDVRVIGATHKQLDALVEQGQFREDLLYRLNVITVRVPPLREREEDIPVLIEHFFRKHSRGKGLDLPHLSPDALRCLRHYQWPGNVRQLENEARRLLVLAGEQIQVTDLSPRVQGTEAAGSASDLDLRQRLDGLERELVERALRDTQGNQTRASKLLGISRFGLQKMIRRLEIDVKKGQAGQSKRVPVTDQDGRA